METKPPSPEAWPPETELTQVPVAEVLGVAEPQDLPPALSNLNSTTGNPLHPGAKGDTDENKINKGASLWTQINLMIWKQYLTKARDFKTLFAYILVTNRNSWLQNSWLTVALSSSGSFPSSRFSCRGSSARR